MKKTKRKFVCLLCGILKLSFTELVLRLCNRSGTEMAKNNSSLDYTKTDEENTTEPKYEVPG
eukprot:snap_masked-scaffold_13-processed-gene-8.51-mRNA-1 protein AED:1.00 eAED:1.00 QI:0/-1/0/0/-1/1/1/0/61